MIVDLMMVMMVTVVDFPTDNECWDISTAPTHLLTY